MMITTFKIYEDLDWDLYTKKRKLINNVIPKLIREIKPISELGKRLFNKIAYQEIGSFYHIKTSKELGFDTNLMYEIFNKINVIKNYIDYNMMGSFGYLKQNLLDKILRRKRMGIIKDKGIINNLINLMPEFYDELKKIEDDKIITNITNAIWSIHPNNPNNKIEEKLNHHKTKDTDKDYYIQKANNYKQMMINLAKLILKYKNNVISELDNYLDIIDIDAYKKLLISFDELHSFILTDQNSIVNMLNDYLKNVK